MPPARTGQKGRHPRWAFVQVEATYPYVERERQIEKVVSGEVSQWWASVRQCTWGPLTASASSLCRPLRALCPQEVLHESPYNRGHGESMFGAPRFERGVLLLWQSNGERLMLAA